MKALKRIMLFLVSLALAGAGTCYYLFFTNNVKGNSDAYIYVRKDSDVEQLLHPFLIRPASFHIMARQMGILDKNHIGKYPIKAGMSDYEICRLLRSGKAEDVVVKIKSEMSRDSLINYFSSVLGANVDSFRAVLGDTSIWKQGLRGEKMFCVFLPDHYFFRWGTDEQSIARRFIKEYDLFWNDERQALADSLSMTREQVCILASIVDGEAIHRSEMSRIAGLYLNRISRNIPLQADPTVLFILEGQNRRRVLSGDLEIEHDYNTYRKTGLPPGPIMLPDKFAIDAVLHAENHNYIYMCARADGSYYHEFTADYNTHVRNAILYRRSLDRSNTMR